MTPADVLAGAPTLTGGAVLAFVVVGVLSFALLRMYAKMTKPTTEVGERTATAVPRPIRHSELAAATGENGAPLYIAMKDPFGSRTIVFDVASGANFYGPGGPYHVFVGKDATMGLAKSSTDKNMVTGDISDLTAAEKDTHMQWYAKYSSKYPQVGWLVDDDSSVDGDVASTTTVDTVAESEESKKDA